MTFIGISTRIGGEEFWFMFSVNKSNDGVVCVDHGTSFPMRQIIGCPPNGLMENSITVTKVRKCLFPNVNALTIWTHFCPL